MCVSVCMYVWWRRKVHLNVSHLFPLFTCRALHQSRGMNCSLLTNHPKLIAALALLFKITLHFDCFIIAFSKSTVWWIMNVIYLFLHYFVSRTRNVGSNMFLPSDYFFRVSEIIALERAVSVAPVAGRNLIRPHRKCAFHLLFLQVASVQLVIDTSSLTENTWGLNQHFPPVILFPLFWYNIIVDLTSCIFLQLSN